MSLGPDIAAVAARIQDRAIQLESERAVLGLVQTERDQQQQILDQESEQCKYVRRKYLSTVQSRHGVELELWKIREEKKECVESTQKMEVETKDFETHKQELQENWGKVAQAVLASHHVKREVYRRSVGECIGQCESQTVRRNLQLFVLAQKADSLRKDSDKYKKKKQRTDEKIDGMAKKEQEEEEEASAIAEKVREALAKRSGLRKALRDAQQANRQANEEMLKWEKECCQAA